MMVSIMSNIRSPIVSVLGHVDHGKSSVLDSIRDTNILATEAGAITQAIGASIVPKDTIINKCGKLLEQLKINLTIPGLLFIDTPGHAAFTSLRKRGGSLADIAIVVVDINEGFKPQTIEAIEILRAAKTPFVIAANKVDLIPRFRKEGVSGQGKNKAVLGLMQDQEASVVGAIETKMYELVGQMYEKFSVVAERFDRVEDFTKQVAIIPISAKEQIGLSETLMVLSALAQKFLEQNLTLNEKGFAKGTILEVKEEKGLGKTLDVIVYNGTLNLNDTIVIGGLDGAIVTRVRAMFEPEANSEMRDKKSSFKSVKTVVAATGVKLGCPDLDGVLSGMPILACNKNPESIEEAKRIVQAEINEAKVETDEQGIIIKADNIGSLEALSVLLREKGVKVRKASVGEISKKDVTEAESNYEQDPLTAIIIGFNIAKVESTEHIKIITNTVIYRLIEEYEIWVEETEKALTKKKLEGLARPGKIQILKNCIFRQSNPCVAGAEVLGGKVHTGDRLMKANGNKLTSVKEIQVNKKNVNEIKKGEQAAISLPNVTGGRQLNEEDTLYTEIPPPDFRELKKHGKLLDPEEIELLKEIAEIKRKEDPFWGK